MKIYISSTFEDLKDYRENVYKQLRKLRHDVISMEDYVAGDQRPLDQCLKDVGTADIYIGIIAWRYGYIPLEHNPDNRSITELEYRHALGSHKQCLIFLLEERTPWSPDLMDAQTGKKDAGKNIRRFRDELAKRHTISKFNNADQLASDVLAAVYRVQFDVFAPSMLALGSQEALESTQRQNTVLPATSRVLPRAGYPNLWEPGIDLSVCFLDGSPKQRRYVERFVPIWCAYANINFKFNDATNAEIRVSFKQPGNWAYVGTDALSVSLNQPTVNLGWINDDTRITEVDYTIIHEFGHVLGLLEEHQNPLAKIPWNKKAVYKAYEGPPNYWSRQTVNNTLFSKWDKKLFPQEKPFDSQSIMLYPIPSEFTSGNFEIGTNKSLSPGDKEYITLLYPFEEETSGEKGSTRHIESTIGYS
jgi:hypothetical protein